MVPKVLRPVNHTLITFHRWGRKVALYLAVLVYLGSGLGLSWTPLANYYVFVLLRFVNGACSAGAYTAACVLSEYTINLSVL